MKKIIPIIIAATALLVLFGCAAKKESSKASPESSEETKAEKTTAEKTAETTSGSREPTVREIYCDNGDKKIYGVAYIADVNRKTPLVILSHGLGANHLSCVSYAKRLVENGYSAYVFDFPNGSSAGLENKSGSDSTKMSVMTEAQALKSVINAAKGWDFTDTDKIFLFGESQGGIVSTVAACDDPDDIAGLMLLYPAFNIPGEVREAYQSLDDVPEEYNLLGAINVGKIYAADVWDLDIYEKLADYNGDVLIVHGDSDSIVDVSYSEKAESTLKNCELHIIEGADHGFNGESYEQAVGYILSYLKERN